MGASDRNMLGSTALCSLLAACAGAPLPPTTNDIDISDPRVLIPSVRVSVDISPRGGSPSAPHAGHAMEADISAARGSGTQTFTSAGELPVVIGSQTFNPPSELKHEFAFSNYEIDYRYRKFFGRSQTLGIEGLAGFAYADLKVTTSSASQSASQSLTDAGIVLGGGGIWRIRPSTSLQARLMQFTPISGETLGRADRGELHLVQAVGRHATVRGGWTWWNVGTASDNMGSSNSSINVRFSGPALALEATF